MVMDRRIAAEICIRQAGTCAPAPAVMDGHAPRRRNCCMLRSTCVGDRFIRMLRQIAYGGTVSLANIAVHAVAMIVVIRVARSVAAKWLPFPTVRLATVMVGTVAVLMAAHMTEIVIWSMAYAFVDVAPEGADQLYFAFVNFT